MSAGGKSILQAMLEAQQLHYAKQAQRELVRSQPKPHIKRIAGTWVCESRGVKSCGSSPKQAYASWAFWVEMNQGRPC